MDQFKGLIASAVLAIATVWMPAAAAQAPECDADQLDQEMKEISKARVAAGPSLYRHIMVLDREKAALEKYRRCASADVDVAFRLGMHLYIRGSTAIEVFTAHQHPESVAEGFQSTSEAREWFRRAAQAGRYSAWRFLGDMDLDARIGTPSRSRAAENYARCVALAAAPHRDYALTCYDLMRQADPTSPLVARAQQILYPPDPPVRQTKPARRPVM